MLLLVAGTVLHERGAQLARFVHSESASAGKELLQQHAGANQVARVAANHFERTIVQPVTLVFDGDSIGKAQGQKNL